MPRQWRGPDSSGLTLKLDQTDLERVFSGSHKWTCRERGEITPTGNHLIMEIISCHGYQSSFDVIGWIHAASGSLGWSVERKQRGGRWIERQIIPLWRSDAAPARICSCQTVITDKHFASTSQFTLIPTRWSLYWMRNIYFSYILLTLHKICIIAGNCHKFVIKDKAGMRAKVQTG